MPDQSGRVPSPEDRRWIANDRSAGGCLTCRMTVDGLSPKATVGWVTAHRCPMEARDA